MKSETKARGVLKGSAFALLLVLGAAFSSSACMSAKGQVRFFSRADLVHPSQDHVDNLVCMGQEDAARLYIQDPAFEWLGPSRDTYLVKAEMRKFRGGCPCSGSTCEEKIAKAKGDGK